MNPIAQNHQPIFLAVAAAAGTSAPAHHCPGAPNQGAPSPAQILKTLAALELLARLLQAIQGGQGEGAECAGNPFSSLLQNLNQGGCSPSTGGSACAGASTNGNGTAAAFSFAFAFSAQSPECSHSHESSAPQAPGRALASPSPRPHWLPANSAPRANQPPANSAPRANQPPANSAPQANQPPANSAPKANEPPANSAPKANEPPANSAPRANQPPANPAPKANEPPANPAPKANEPPANPAPKPKAPPTQTDKMWDVWFDHTAGQKTEQKSPIVLDLNKNGRPDITGANITGNGKIDGATTMFDLDPTQSSWSEKSMSKGMKAKMGMTDKLPEGELKADGMWHYGREEKREKTEWLARDGGDGLLAWDVNGDGKINSGKELFGNFDVDGSNKFEDGYQKLAQHFDKNKDGVVNGRELEGLSVWQDGNADGVTQDGELKSVAEHGITSLNVSQINRDDMSSSFQRI